MNAWQTFQYYTRVYIYLVSRDGVGVKGEIVSLFL